MIRKFAYIGSYLFGFVFLTFVSLVVVSAFTGPSAPAPGGDGTPLGIPHGGTGGTTASEARDSLEVAKSGSNIDITSLSPTGNLILNPANSVGIGTTSPGSKLHVNGTFQLQTGTSVNTISTSTSLGTSNDALATQGAIKSYVDSTAGGGVGSGTSGQTLRHDGASWVSSSLLYNNGTNIGINTANPGSRLHVNGTFQLATGTSVNSISTSTSLGTSNDALVTQAAIKSYVDSTAGGGVGSGTSGQTLRHDGASWVANSLLYNDGNRVGIGTTGPNFDLEVDGDIAASGRGIFSSLKDQITISHGNNLSQERWKIAYTDDIPGLSWGIAIDDVTADDTRLFLPRADNEQDGFINVPGNFGIGTTSPGSKLHVNGTFQLQTGTSVNTISTSTSLGTSNNALATQGAIKSYVDSVAGGGFTGGGTSNFITKWTGSDSLGNSQIFDNGTSVGIGTTSPVDRLSVVGRIQATKGYHFFDTRDDDDAPQDLSSRALSLDFKRRSSIGNPISGVSASGTYAHIMTIAGWNTNEGSGGWPMQLTFGSQGIGIRQATNENSWGSWRTTVVAQPNGNVGIGTTSPGTKLHVNGTFRLQTGTSVNTISTSTSLGTSNDALATQGAIKSYVDSQVSDAGGKKWDGADDTTGAIGRTGNVGIGITSPVVKLHVGGEGRFDGNLNMNNNNITGVNKLTVAEIDPIYNIGGGEYSTYAPFIPGGVKEEVVGVLKLDVESPEYIIDFENLERGSDLWVFYQVTDFGDDMQNMQVLLTAGFNGNVWYEKNSAENILAIYGSNGGEVSYRLTADRIDIEDLPRTGEGVIHVDER